MTPCRLAFLLVSIVALHGCGGGSGASAMAPSTLTGSDPDTSEIDSSDSDSAGVDPVDADLADPALSDPVLSDPTSQTTSDEADEAPGPTGGQDLDGAVGDADATGEPEPAQEPGQPVETEGPDDIGQPVETDEPGATGQPAEPDEPGAIDLPGDTNADALSDDDDVFRPAFADGSDEARLFIALNEIVVGTILTLDELMAGGASLSERQETCLGAFDPAFGEHLLAIDCDPEQPLASNIRPVYVRAASLHETDDCQLGLSEGRVEDCVIRAAEVFIFTQFGTAEFPQRPSPLPGTGVEIGYAVDGLTLTIENDETALNGRFRCEIDLVSGTALTPDECEDVLGTVVDRLSQLQEAG